MRNPWKARRPDGAEMWDEAQRRVWMADETDRLMLWWWSFPLLAVSLLVGALATCGALGWLG